MSDANRSAASDLLRCYCHGEDLVPYCPRHTPLLGESRRVDDSPAAEGSEREIVERLRRNGRWQTEQGLGNGGLLADAADIIAEQDREIARLQDVVARRVTMETVRQLEACGSWRTAEIARKYAVDRPRWWHRFTRRAAS